MKNPATATQAGSAVAARGKKPTPLQRMVLVAARIRCDEMQDSQPAREAMRRQVLDTPAALLMDLHQALQQFRPKRCEFVNRPTTTEGVQP